MWVPPRPRPAAAPYAPLPMWLRTDVQPEHKPVPFFLRSCVVSDKPIPPWLRTDVQQENKPVPHFLRPGAASDAEYINNIPRDMDKYLKEIDELRSRGD